MRIDGSLTQDSVLHLRQALERDAQAARSRADSGGDVYDLARLLDIAQLQHPVLRSLFSEEGRAVLTARWPDLAKALTRYEEHPWSVEAQLRERIGRAQGQLRGSALSISALMAAARSDDVDRRRAADAALATCLDDISGSGPAERLRRCVKLKPSEAPLPAPELQPRAVTASPGGLLLVPSAELVEGIGSGILDAGLLSALAQPPTQRPLTTRGAPETASPPPKEPGTTTSEGEARLKEMMRALRDALGVGAAGDFGEWRAACAASRVADFTLTDALVLSASSVRALPFEVPLVPLSRPLACAEASGNAWGSTAHALGRGAVFGGAEFGAALLLTTCTRAFALRGLRDRPVALDRAVRALALSVLLRYFGARCAARARGDAEALRSLYGDALGSAPTPALARVWALEAALSCAPGEEAATYGHGLGLAASIRRGVSLAYALREAFDEDWYRNPRLTRERVRDLVLTASESSEDALLEWVRAAAPL